MALNERVRELINQLNVSDSEFAISIKYSNMNLSNFLKGVTKNPKADLLINIAKAYPKINLNWLLLGKGEMWKSKKEVNKELNQKLILSYELVKEMKNIMEMVLVQFPDDIEENINTEKQI